MSVSAIREVERSKFVEPSLPPPTTPIEFTSSSLAKSDRETWGYQIVTSSLRREVSLNHRFDYTKRAFEYECQQAEAIAAREEEKRKECQEKEQAQSSWDIYKHTFSYVSSAATMTLGIGCVIGGSPAIGGSLIASGVSNIANDVMQEVHGWQKISQSITSEKEKQDTYANYMQMGIRVFSLATGLVGGFQSSFLAHMPWAKTAAEALKNTTLIASGITGIGSGFAESKTLKAKSKHMGIKQEVQNNNDNIVTINDIIRQQTQLRKDAHRLSATIIRSHEACLKIINKT